MKLNRILKKYLKDEVKFFKEGGIEVAYVKEFDEETKSKA